MSVGYEHIDLKECQKRDIGVCNTPNVSTDSVAELTVALLLLTARRLLEGMNSNVGKRTFGHVRREDSDQSAHSRSLIRIFTGHIFR